jgi:hypothetical protein
MIAVVADVSRCPEPTPIVEIPSVSSCIAIPVFQLQQLCWPISQICSRLLRDTPSLSLRVQSTRWRYQVPDAAVQECARSPIHPTSPMQPAPSLSIISQLGDEPKSTAEGELVNASEIHTTSVASRSPAL